MRSVAHVLSITLLAFASGCWEANRELNGIRRDIARFPEILLTTGNHPDTEAESLTVRICALSTEEQKDECFEKWADTLFAFDLTRIPVEDSERFFRCVLLMGDFAFSKMYRHRALTFTEKYNCRFRHLEWLRRQIRLVDPPRTYPEGVQMIWDLSGRAHWDVRRKDYPKLERYRKLLARYSDCANDFDASVIWCEVTLYGDKTFNETKEERDAVKARLAALLGRRLRTKDEVYADSRERRHRDYPYLVPTPNGLVECWTQAEVERAKQKPASCKRDDAVVPKSKS